MCFDIDLRSQQNWKEEVHANDDGAMKLRIEMGENGEILSSQNAF